MPFQQNPYWRAFKEIAGLVYGLLEFVLELADLF